MDTNVTEVYETTANVDVNKQVPFQQNMDFTEENFTTDSQVGSDGFHLQSGDQYNVQHETETYNPSEQQIGFQDPGLENVSNPSYCTIQETDVQQPYTPEQPPLKHPTTALTNNGVNENQIISNIEPQAGDDTIGENTLTDDKDDSLIVVPVESNTDIIDETINSGTNTTNQTAESSINPVESTTDSGVNNTDSIEGTQPVDTNAIESSIDQVESGVEDTVTEACPSQPKEILEKSKNGDGSDSVNEIVVNQNIGNSQNCEKMEQGDEKNSNNEVISVIEDNAETSQEVINLEFEEENVLEPDEEGDTVKTENVELTQLKAYDQIIESQDHYMVVETPSSGDVIESSDIQLVEVYADSPEEKQDKVSQKKTRRTRKPIHDLPMHLIGHDISKPVENVPNGRALPKPRLGVKVPYLNLTSQIVSKAELEEEIIERSRAKEQANEKNENKFARGLTQRLANKIAPEENKKQTSSKENNKKTDKQESKDDKKEIKTDVSSQGSNNSIGIDESKIQNDDDLLAILEGDGEEMPVIEKVQDTETDDTNLRLIEREIALQQLQELPRQLPKERIIKPRYPRGDQKAKTTIISSKTATPKSGSLKSDVNSKSDIHSKADIASKADTPSPTPSPKKSTTIDLDVNSSNKKPVEIEPQVRVNMVLKTYSRKRKPSDMPEFDTPSPKRPTFEDPDSNDIFEMKSDPLALPTDVYVTKSSRVIKKKVIWDPDDDQNTKGQKLPSKVTDGSKVSTTPKVVKPVSSDKLEKSEKKTTVTQAEKIKETKEKPSEKNEKVSPKKTIVKTKSPPKTKRGLSEVDKLLMDEGAIKMLYELKGSDEHSAKKKKGVYSVEKAEKELLKRANVLKNDLVQNTSNESPKSLRKKEGFPIISPNVKQPPPILERKLSKDSTRSSVHTPPRSPTFFNSQTSMLIRRRSSSSISSEEEVELNKLLKSSKKQDSTKSKKQKKRIADESESSFKESQESSTESTPIAIKGAQYKSFTMKKSGKHVSIDLEYVDDKCYFTTDVLSELTAALKRLEKDKDCNVVSLTSTKGAFCLGLDYASLVTDDKKERTEKAVSLAESVRDFLWCLLHFPKVIVAAIQGDCVGIGVTMLSLFDMVIASDKATFRTPYASLGCMGEATFLLTYPHLNDCGLAAELLYANEHLKADEAFKRGLISKLCWPEKYKDTLNNFVTSVAQGSRQSLETTKRQLRMNAQDQFKAAINDEMDILIQHWTSPECQDNFAKIKK